MYGDHPKVNNLRSFTFFYFFVSLEKERIGFEKSFDFCFQTDLYFLEGLEYDLTFLRKCLSVNVRVKLCVCMCLSACDRNFVSPVSEELMPVT